MTGRKFGRYEIKSEMGRGGMAVVYEALDPQLGRTVALKVLPAQFMHDPTFLGRFEREAHTVARLEHYAIVPLYDYGEHEGQPFLVMRYMSGGTLADKLRDGALDIEQSMPIMERVCAALDKAHLNGIVHRDLKPGNILFDDENAAYLSDFGIVRLSGQTHTHTVIGTPHYMAPEQAHGWPVDSRTDIYQMGVVLFNMLSGRVPFDADTLPALLHKHAYESVPSIREFVPDLPPSIDVVIKRAMAKEKGARYQSTIALVTALRDVAEGRTLLEEATTVAGPVGTPTSARPNTAEDRAGLLGRWAFYGGFLLVALIAAGALMVSRLSQNGDLAVQQTVEAVSTPQLTEAALAFAATGTPSPTGTLSSARATMTLTPPRTISPTTEPTVTMTPSPTAEPIIRIVRESAPVYSGPGTNYGLLRILPVGQTVLVLAKTVDERWFNVELSDGSRAWLAAEDGEEVERGSVSNVEAAGTVPPLPPTAPRTESTVTPTAVIDNGSDRDGDGIADTDDACPDVYGIQELDGCTIGEPSRTPTSNPPPQPTVTPTAYP